MMLRIFLVAIGGAIGSSFRFLLIELLKKTNLLADLPLGTILVNFIGATLAGVFYFYSTKQQFDQKIIDLLAIGFLGGFTTFSALSLDFLKLMQGQQQFQAIFYLTLSFFFALCCAPLGFYLAKYLCK